MAYRKTEFVERKRLETRTRIVKAAADLVRAHGWRGCALKAIAESAGVATGSIYTHCDKITDLYQEAYSVIAAEELSVIEKMAAREGSAAQRLGWVVDTFTTRALRGRVQAYAMIGEPVAPEVEALRQRFRREFAAPVERLVQGGLEAGELPEQDPAASAACILGVLSESMISPLAPEASTNADRGRALQREVRAFCLRAVGAGESGGAASASPTIRTPKNKARKGGS